MQTLDVAAKQVEAGGMETPAARPSQSGPPTLAHWLLWVSAAVLLHATVLGMILGFPRGATRDEKTATAEVIMLQSPTPAPASSPSAEETATAEAPMTQSPFGPQADPLPLPPPAVSAVEPVPASPDIATPLPKVREQPQTAAAPVPVKPPPAAASPHALLETVTPAPPRTAHPVPVAHNSAAEPLATPPASSMSHEALPQADTLRSQPPSGNALGAYRDRLAAHLKAYQRYPALARARREQGLVVIDVTIQRSGEIVAMAIERGSGSSSLDEEALATLKRANPLPAMPADLPGATMALTFPLRFHLE